ncbi:MAG TPA: SIMPL domain-containing protein [Longimicrobiales bacterium]|nr:SIMPL domain-containing protein [Longimicrobiales bacterium]
MKRILLLAALLAPAGAAAQQVPVPPRTVTVSANAMVERAPDQAVLVLAVESQATTAREAARANATKMERVVAALRQAGVAGERIRTIGYELIPEYAQETRGRDAPRIVSYRAVNRVQVTIDAIDRVGTVLDASIEAGANRASSLHFRLRDPADARMEALRLATQKARAEAQAIVTAADEVLGPVLSIHTDSFMPPPPPPMPGAMYDRMAVSMEAASTPVEQGTISISAHVTMVFQLGR